LNSSRNRSIDTFMLPEIVPQRISTTFRMAPVVGLVLFLCGRIVWPRQQTSIGNDDAGLTCNQVMGLEQPIIRDHAFLDTRSRRATA